MSDVLFNEEFLTEKKFKELFNSEVKKLKEKFKLFSDEEYKKNLEIELNEILNIYIKENSVNFDRNILRCVESGAAGAVAGVAAGGVAAAGGVVAAGVGAIVGGAAIVVAGGVSVGSYFITKNIYMLFKKRVYNKS